MGPASDGLLVGMSVLLAVPSLMIFLAAALRPWVSRWLNVGLGVFYTGIEGLTLLGSPLFYRVVAVGEIGVTVLIVVYALRWPKRLTRNGCGTVY